MVLENYALLLSRGWEWLLNCSANDVSEVLTDLMFHSEPYEYKQGMPKGGAKYSSEQLKLQGMVGIYKRGGRLVAAEVPSLPSCPFPSRPLIFDEPILEKPSRPQITTDRPPQKILDRVA